MKYTLSLLSFFLFVCSSVFSQDPPRDTAWGNWPQQEYYNGILDAPVVTGATTAVTITPNGQKLCFDKRLKIKTLTGSGPVEQCMYLNTKEGYVGILPPRNGPELCDIKPDDPKFIFFVLGLKGNAYTFRNSKKNLEIEHWVTTGNTQTHQYNMTASAGSATLHKKTERRGYCGDKIKTWAYKHDNPSSPVFFLFGKTFPAEVDVSSTKFIGSFGVGYQFTDKGLFIVMEMESGNYGCKITELEEVNICFDPSVFKIGEDEFYTQMQASLQREREKIARDEAAASGDCSSEKMTVINFRKEQVRVQEARMYTAQQGNLYQDLPSQQAMGQMLDHIAMTKQLILENEVKICQAQKRLERTTSQTSRERYHQRISCLNRQIAEMQSLQGQLEALDIQYASEPGRAFAEKSKKFMQGLPGGCQ